MKTSSVPSRPLQARDRVGQPDRRGQPPAGPDAEGRVLAVGVVHRPRPVGDRPPHRRMHVPGEPAVAGGERVGGLSVAERGPVSGALQPEPLTGRASRGHRAPRAAGRPGSTPRSGRGRAGRPAGRSMTRSWIPYWGTPARCCWTASRTRLKLAAKPLAVPSQSPWTGMNDLPCGGATAGGVRPDQSHRRRHRRCRACRCRARRPPMRRLPAERRPPPRSPRRSTASGVSPAERAWGPPSWRGIAPKPSQSYPSRRAPTAADGRGPIVDRPGRRRPMPTFCRHNRLVQNCPICSKEQHVDMRPVVSPGGHTVRPPRARRSRAPAPRAAAPERRARTRRGSGGLTVRRLSRAAEDGFRSRSSPGCAPAPTPSASPRSWPSPPPGSSGSPPIPPGSTPRSPMPSRPIEERTWLAFLIAYLGPPTTRSRSPASSRRARHGARASHPGSTASPTGPRTAHEAGRGQRTIDAYRAWASGPGPRRPPSPVTPPGRRSGASPACSNGWPCPACIAARA